MSKLNKNNSKYKPYLSVIRVKGQYGVFKYSAKLRDERTLNTYPNAISANVGGPPETPTLVPPYFKTILPLEGYIRYRNYNKKLFSSLVNDEHIPDNGLKYTPDSIITSGTGSSILALLSYLKNYKLADVGPGLFEFLETDCININSGIPNIELKKNLRACYFNTSCKLVNSIATKYDLVIRDLIHKYANIDLDQIDILVQYLFNKDTCLIGLTSIINIENMIEDNDYNKLVTDMYHNFSRVHTKALVEVKKLKAIASQYKLYSDNISNIDNKFTIDPPTHPNSGFSMDIMKDMIGKYWDSPIVNNPKASSDPVASFAMLAEALKGKWVDIPKSNVNVNLHGIYGEAIDEEFKRLYKAMKPKTKL